MRVLVTGASGFVGSTLCEVLARAGHIVRAALRTERSVPACVPEKVIVGDMTADVDWRPALTGVDAVVHAAARAHVLRDSAENANLYITANAQATRRLVQSAAEGGVRRFVYLSSIKVNGEQTHGKPYTPADTPRPQDPYGVSKLLAEKALLEVCAGSATKVAIVRPPLVYGPGVRANFLRLLRWVDRQIPLPLGSVTNSRSLVSVWNLCDLLERLLEEPLSHGRTWLVSDGEDLSTPQLVRRIAHAMQRRACLLPAPPALLRSAGTLIGKRAEVDRLCGSLVVDISETRRELGWTPPIDVDDALARTVNWYLREAGHGR
jgi:nucleoside-diphosphate-sugar epimerase